MCVCVCGWVEIPTVMWVAGCSCVEVGGITSALVGGSFACAFAQVRMHVWRVCV